MSESTHCGTETIVTERLILRRFRREDKEAFYRNWASRDEVTRYLTWPTHRNVEDTERILSLWVDSYADPTVYHWGITLKGKDEVVGDISVVRHDDKVSSMELGWCLSPFCWGQGIMPEAAGAVRDYLFVRTGLHRLEARHDCNNPNSGRVMEKIGMLREGMQRQAGKNNQGLCDLVLYGMLREDWEGLCTEV